MTGMATGGLRAFASNLQVTLGDLELWFFVEPLIPWNRRNTTKTPQCMMQRGVLFLFQCGKIKIG